MNTEGKKSIGQIVSTKIRTKKLNSIPIWNKIPSYTLPCLSDQWLKSFLQAFKPDKEQKKRDLCEGKSRSSSRPRVHLSEWDFSSAVGSEVRLCDGWRCSGLLSDVVTAWAVALLVWDALREGELVHLRSLFFQLQRGFWKTKARHKNADPWNERLVKDDN